MVDDHPQGRIEDLSRLPLEDTDCMVRAFTIGGRTRGAYQTDCRSWETLAAATSS